MIFFHFFTQAQDVAYFKQRKAVHLRCEIDVKLKSVSTFNWKINGRHHQEHILDPDGTLTIRRPTKKDEGIYQCFARNAVGISVSRTIKLIHAG